MIFSAILLSSTLVMASAIPQQYNRPFNQQNAVPLPQRNIVPAQQNVAVTSVQQQNNPNAYARILRQEQDTQFDGNFRYSYETENGIAQQATGILKDPGTDHETQVIQGSYSYTAPDGQVITITYIADEEGFKPQGDAIPTAPPIPEAIARSLEYLRTLPVNPNQNA